jgi:methylmalonyl-CoA mutase C-terminal domain/subunit
LKHPLIEKYFFPRVMVLLKEKGIEDILVLGGGIIPEKDIPALHAVGIAAIFRPGTNTGDIIKFIQGNIH